MKYLDFDEAAHYALLVVWVLIVVLAFATSGVYK